MSTQASNKSHNMRLEQLKQSSDDFLRQEVTQMSDRAHEMGLEELKESNGDFLRQEVTAANDCRMI